MDRPLLQIISEFIFTQTYSTLPDHIKIIAREHLLDTLGCCLAATKLETTQALVHTTAAGQQRYISRPHQPP